LWQTADRLAKGGFSHISSPAPPRAFGGAGRYRIGDDRPLTPHAGGGPLRSALMHDAITDVPGRDRASANGRRLVATVDKQFYQPGETIELSAVAYDETAAGTTDYYEVPKIPKGGTGKGGKVYDADISEQLRALRTEMFQAAENLEFERAAKLRDELKKLEALAGSGKNGSSDASPVPKTRRILPSGE